MLFTFLFPPFFPILWVFFLLVFIQIHIPGSRPEAFAEHVFAFIFHGTCVESWLVFFCFFVFLPTVNSLPWETAIQSPWGLNRQRAWFKQSLLMCEWVWKEKELDQKGSSVPGRMCTCTQGTGIGCCTVVSGAWTHQWNCSRKGCGQNVNLGQSWC